MQCIQANVLILPPKVLADPLYNVISVLLVPDQIELNPLDGPLHKLHRPPVQVVASLELLQSLYGV